MDMTSLALLPVIDSAASGLFLAHRTVLPALKAILGGMAQYVVAVTKTPD